VDLNNSSRYCTGMSSVRTARERDGGKRQETGLPHLTELAALGAKMGMKACTRGGMVSLSC